MPYTATLAIVAAAAMAGVPLLNGFLSKEMFFAEALDLRGVGLLGALAPGAVLAGGAFGVAYSARFIHDVFFNGEPHDLPRTPHEPPRFMKVPVEILVAVCLAVGVAPALTVAPLVDAASRAVLAGAPPEYSLALWHGFTAPLGLSVLATRRRCGDLLGAAAQVQPAPARAVRLDRAARVPAADGRRARRRRPPHARPRERLAAALARLPLRGRARARRDAAPRQRHPGRRPPARAAHPDRRGRRDRARRGGARVRGLSPQPPRRGDPRRRRRPRGVGGLPPVLRARPRADAARRRGRHDRAAAAGAGARCRERARTSRRRCAGRATGSSPADSGWGRASSRWRR